MSFSFKLLRMQAALAHVMQALNITDSSRSEEFLGYKQLIVGSVHTSVLFCSP